MVGGDRFAAGPAYGFLTGETPQQAVEYGAAHGATAMTTPGDTSMAGAPGRDISTPEGLREAHREGLFQSGCTKLVRDTVDIVRGMPADTCGSLQRPDE